MPAYLSEQEIITEAKGEVITDVDTIIRHLKTWLDKKESFVSGNRNNYISRLAGAYNRYGISISRAESDLLSYVQEDFTAEEIKAIVNSIYRNTIWHNTAQFKVNKKEKKEQK
ncbi:primase C-terminal domain-containing protein, partial [Bacteroidia bacterium]|nr:primase C-terminal domain-containing protein [Bacteroidia bacterium]